MDHVAAATAKVRLHLVGVGGVRQAGDVCEPAGAVDRDAARGAGERQRLDHPRVCQRDVDDPNVVLSPPRGDGPVEPPVSGERPARREMTERHKVTGRDQPPAVAGGPQRRTDSPGVADLGGDGPAGEHNEHGKCGGDANGTAPHRDRHLSRRGATAVCGWRFGAPDGMIPARCDQTGVDLRRAGRGDCAEFRRSGARRQAAVARPRPATGWPVWQQPGVQRARLSRAQPLAGAAHHRRALRDQESGSHDVRSRRPDPERWWQWLAYDLPGGTRHLAEGAGATGGRGLPHGGRQGRNDFSQVNYGGPCPPVGAPAHRYQLIVWADRLRTLPVTTSSSAALISLMNRALRDRALDGRRALQPLTVRRRFRPADVQGAAGSTGADSQPRRVGDARMRRCVDHLAGERPSTGDVDLAPRRARPQ